MNEPKRHVLDFLMPNGDDWLAEDRAARPPNAVENGLLLLYPPLVTAMLSTAWCVLAFLALGAVGIILYLLTPLLCAVWAFRICKRLSRKYYSSDFSGLFALLFAIELVMIAAAFLLFTPRWD